jgi:hypothetical protein
VQVALQPVPTSGLVQQLVNRKINHASDYIRCSALWLHMSRSRYWRRSGSRKSVGSSEGPFPAGRDWIMTLALHLPPHFTAIRKQSGGNCENAKVRESAKGAEWQTRSPGAPLLCPRISRFRSFSRFRSSFRRPFPNRSSFHAPIKVHLTCRTDSTRSHSPPLGREPGIGAGRADPGCALWRGRSGR